MPGEEGIGIRNVIFYKRIIGNQNPSWEFHGTRLLAAQPNLRTAAQLGWCSISIAVISHFPDQCAACAVKRLT